MQYTDKYRSPLGEITLASDGDHLTGLWFDGQKYFAATLSAEHQERELPIFEQAKEWLESYFMDQDGLDDIEISQFMKHKTGWNQAWVNDEFIRGYTGELQNFMDAVAYDLGPDSGFSLAYDTVRIVYAAYQSAEEGRRISF